MLFSSKALGGACEFKGNFSSQLLVTMNHLTQGN